eukprot:2480889-Pleurochrysis_carterae.AAC.2
MVDILVDKHVHCLNGQLLEVTATAPHFVVREKLQAALKVRAAGLGTTLKRSMMQFKTRLHHRICADADELEGRNFLRGVKPKRGISVPATAFQHAYGSLYRNHVADRRTMQLTCESTTTLPLQDIHATHLYTRWACKI